MGRSETPLIGREKETRLLEQVISEALRGHKRAVKLFGEPGMGKTALLQWVHERCSLEGFVCAIARCSSTGGLPTGYLTADLLNSIASSLREKDLSSQLISSLRPPFTLGVHGSRPNILEVADALNEALSHGKLALFLDDLQWAHVDEVRLLFASLNLVDRPTVLVMAQRKSAPDPLRNVRLVVTAGFPVSRMEISGLDLDAVAELATQRIGAPILPSLAQGLYARTQGNPLFVNETLRAWVSSGVVVALSGGYWGFSQAGIKPDADSLLEMISARVGRVGQDALRVASTLALLGRPASASELATICGQTDSRAVDLLRELDEHGIVEHGELSHKFEITHPLYQSALIGDLNSTQRGILHESIHTTLANQPEESSASELAFHAQRALSHPDGLGQLLLAAAQEAELAGSNLSAADWYEGLVRISSDSEMMMIAIAGQAENVSRFDPKLAVSLFSQALDLSQSSTQRARFLLGRAKAQRGAGHSTEALADLELATTMARSVDAADILDAALVTKVAMGESHGAEEDWAELAELTKGTPIYGRVLGHLAMVPYVTGDVSEAKTRCERALQEPLNPFDLRNVRVNLSWFLTLLGFWQEARLLTDSLLLEAERARDLWALIPVTNTAAHLAAWSGDVERALDLGAHGLAITNHHLSDPGDRLTSLSAYSAGLLEIGLAREVVELLSQVPADAASLEEKVEVNLSFTLLAEAYATLGYGDRAASVSGEGRKHLHYNRSCLAGMDRVDALIALRGGDARQALTILNRWIEDPSELRFEQGRIHELAASAYFRVGQKDLALSQAEMARDIYSHLGARLRQEKIDRWIGSQRSERRGRPRSRLAGDLTPREHQILKLLAAGQTNVEIAGALFISPATVKKHVENIKRKAGTNRRTALASFYLDLHSEGSEREASSSLT